MRVQYFGQGPVLPDHVTTDYSPALGLELVRDGTLVLVRMEGPLDQEHARGFLTCARSFCQGARRVLLDVRRLRFVDSAGVRALLELQSEVENTQGTLRLAVQPGSRVARTLSLLQLLGRFGIGDLETEAWLNQAEAACPPAAGGAGSTWGNRVVQ
jgi:anti-anti-sigma factor